MKRLLVTVAHPDDEAFGPAGTIAKYANDGVEVHLLCATRGEAGEWHEESRAENKKIHHIREEELLKSAKVLSVTKVQLLDFIEGKLCNDNYHQLAEKIIKKIETFKPQVIVTLDRLGISGHLDHIAVSMVTTFAHRKTQIANKLYYHVLPKSWYEERMKKYFIYFPEGYGEKDITTRIDFSKFWDIKQKSMLIHQSQRKDALNILKGWKKRKKINPFILQNYQGINVELPEKDLFLGIKY